MEFDTKHWWKEMKCVWKNAQFKASHCHSYRLLDLGVKRQTGFDCVCAVNEQTKYSWCDVRKMVTTTAMKKKSLWFWLCYVMQRQWLQNLRYSVSKWEMKYFPMKIHRFYFKNFDFYAIELKLNLTMWTSVFRITQNRLSFLFFLVFDTIFLKIWSNIRENVLTFNKLLATR